MAIIRWKGAAQAVAQVNTLTVGGTPFPGQKYTITISNKSLTYTSTGADSNATIATALISLCSGSSIPEFQEITWAAGSTTTAITATASDPGKPFTQTSSAIGGTLVTVATTANTGPSVVSVAQNWSTGVLPTNGDTVVLASTSVSLLYDLTYFAGINLASLQINSDFTGTIGLPETNTDNQSYLEYRPKKWQIGAAAITVGLGNPGNGSGRIKVDTLAFPVTWNVWQTGSPQSDGDITVEPIQWIGTNAANVINLYSGTMAAAGLGGETATIATLRLGYDQSQASDATLRCGPGCTLGTISQNGGTLSLYSPFTSLVQTAGTVVCNDTVSTPSLMSTGGSIFWRTAGILQFLSLENATLTTAGDPRPHTIYEAQLYPGFALLDPEATLNLGAVLCFEQCGLPDGTLNLGPNRSLQITTCATTSTTTTTTSTTTGTTTTTTSTTSTTSTSTSSTSTGTTTTGTTTTTTSGPGTPAYVFYVRQIAEGVSVPPSGFFAAWNSHSTISGNSAFSLLPTAATGGQNGGGENPPIVGQGTSNSFAWGQFLSPALAAQNVSSGNWTFGWAMAIFNATALHVWTPYAALYLVNGATGAIRTTIFALGSIGATNRSAATEQSVYSATVSGASFTAQPGDYLALEIGVLQTATGTSWDAIDVDLFYEGNTPVTSDNVTVTDEQSAIIPPVGIYLR